MHLLIIGIFIGFVGYPILKKLLGILMNKIDKM